MSKVCEATSQASGGSQNDIERIRQVESRCFSTSRYLPATSWCRRNTGRRRDRARLRHRSGRRRDRHLRRTRAENNHRRVRWKRRIRRVRWIRWRVHIFIWVPPANVASRLAENKNKFSVNNRGPKGATLLFRSTAFSFSVVKVPALKSPASDLIRNLARARSSPIHHGCMNTIPGALRKKAGALSSPNAIRRLWLSSAQMTGVAGGDNLAADGPVPISDFAAAVELAGEERTES